METRLLIRGEQVDGQGDVFAVENPATEETLAELREPAPEQLADAVSAAATPRANGRPHRRSSAPRCCTRSPRGFGHAPTRSLAR
jgi:acyl-CoA reductase-like NAD-dependent aldehyde dehydrogenase